MNFKADGEWRVELEELERRLGCKHAQNVCMYEVIKELTKILYRNI